MSAERQDGGAKTWEWFGHAGHFICGKDCRFHLTTRVGDFLVSTVGELWPSRSAREIEAKFADPAWLAKNRHLKGDHFDAEYMKRFGFSEVGCDRLYETMVFVAGDPCRSRTCGCGLPSIDGMELDFAGYQTAAAARRGHMGMCFRWAERDAKTVLAAREATND